MECRAHGKHLGSDYYYYHHHHHHIITITIDNEDENNSINNVSLTFLISNTHQHEWLTVTECLLCARLLSSSQAHLYKNH